MGRDVFDVGASLAAARETRGWSLADAERLTCIRARYLAALERSDFDALPGRTYARAFLRTYAVALGLEPDRFVSAFEELVPEQDEPVALPAPRRRRVRRREVAAGIVAAAAIGVVVWAASSRTAHPLAPQAAPTVQTHRAAAVLGTRHTVRSHPPPSRPAPLVVRATRGDCWLLVRRGGANGPVLYEGTLHEGSVARFAAPHVWVRLGAPGMVDMRRGSSRVHGLTGADPVDITA